MLTFPLSNYVHIIIKIPFSVKLIKILIHSESLWTRSTSANTLVSLLSRVSCTAFVRSETVSENVTYRLSDVRGHGKEP